jgi:hypothetical protein
MLVYSDFAFGTSRCRLICVIVLVTNASQAAIDESKILNLELASQDIRILAK